MTDAHPETVTLHLGGKDRRFKLGPAAFRLAQLKHKTNISMAALQSPSFDVFATLAWVGLLPGNPDLKEEEVVRWMGAEDVDENAIVGVVATALSRMVEGLSKAFEPTPGKPIQGKPKTS
jgi:hypothetical protein